jgi:perosamine synthetase
LRIPLSKPYLDAEEEEAVAEVIKSKYLASGEVVESFEDALALKFNRKYCTAVNSGSSALCLSLRILGLKNVIIPSLTCPDVLHAVLNAGSKPVFCDIEPETHNIDLSTLSEKQLRSSDGLIVTHAYGHAADMDKLEYFITKYSLCLVEDFAQATGGKYKEKIVGSYGMASTTSFYAAKNMTTGYGGAIFTDDPEVHKKCLHARGDTPYHYYEDIVPLNYKLTDIQAAIGLIQLKRLEEMVNKRRIAAHKFTSILKEFNLQTPVEKPGVKHAYYKFHLVLPENIQKQGFRAEMDKQGVATGTLYDPPLHKTLLAKKLLRADITLPVAESMASKTLSLPLFPEMTDWHINQVHYAIMNVLRILR